MILVDTSIWVDHFNRPEGQITDLAEAGDLFVHPYIIGELAMGGLRDRANTITMLGNLPLLLPVRHSEIMKLIENQSLYGTGLQYVDVHLLAATLVTQGCLIWTRDKRLHSAAETLGVAA